jgi:hypothetical protein
MIPSTIIVAFLKLGSWVHLLEPIACTYLNQNPCDKMLSWVILNNQGKWMLRAFMITSALKASCLNMTICTGVLSLLVLGQRRMWVMRFNQLATKNVQKGIKQEQKCWKANHIGGGALGKWHATILASCSFTINYGHIYNSTKATKTMDYHIQWTLVSWSGVHSILLFMIWWRWWHNCCWMLNMVIVVVNSNMKLYNQSNIKPNIWTLHVLQDLKI